MRRIRLPLLLAMLAAIPVATAAPPRGAVPAVSPVAAPADDIVDLDTLVVSGEQPGPGMWKVRRGDNVLYLLGTLSPLPRRMEWIPDEVEATIARSQAVIDPPSLAIDGGVGLFRGLTLVPSLLRARRNPDGRSLEEAVGPELYARWSALKPRYLGRDRAVESRRPIFAAQELYEGAMRRAGLSQDNVVEPIVERAARRHRVPRVSTKVSFVLEDPKALIREFNDTTLDDGDCFARTLSRIETDMSAMRDRANAWAVGDVAALRDLPLEDQYVACIRAVTESGIAQRAGLVDVRERMTAAWMTAAETALAEHPVSFGALPLPFLLRPDGFLERLRQRGYVVEEP